MTLTVVFGEALPQGLIVALQHIDWLQRLGRTAGLGFFAGDRWRSAHDMLSGIDDVLVAAVVVTEHHPRGARRRELLVERHEVTRRTATPTVNRLPVIADTQQR